MALDKPLEILASLRAARHTPEIKLVIQWLSALEKQATTDLIAATAAQHDEQAGVVRVLQRMQKQISEPSLDESQAAYRMKPNVHTY